MTIENVASDILPESQHPLQDNSFLIIHELSQTGILPEVAALEKQRKKELGRQRAKEIAIQRGRSKPNDQRQASSRHGARNQDRHQKFTRWLLKKFPHILNSNATLNEEENNDKNNEKYILDVAGGKGELAARLVLCHNISVVMVDPRKANIRKCYEEVVFKNLPKRHQEAYRAKIENGQEYLIDQKLEKKFKQLVQYFIDDDMLQNPASLLINKMNIVCSSKDRLEDRKLNEAVQNASLLIGMHSDGATEAIVNMALKYSKPFVVVPCCVFPNLFVKRVIQNEQGDMVKVRSHEQFCTYLERKDERFVREILPFHGRNVAIWWDGT